MRSKTMGLWLLMGVILMSCARAPLKERERAMRRVSAPELSDDLPLPALLDAAAAEIKFLEVSNGNYAEFRFGERTYSKEEYLTGLRRFVELGRTHGASPEFFAAVKAEFEFFEVYGEKKWGEAFLTSYYEPFLEGSLKKTAKFTQPVYARPKDLYTLNLSAFDPKFAPERKYRGRISGDQILPYYSREEIDVGRSLKDRKLELCWLDPVDAFFLQIQGSGTVRLPGGKELRLNYADANGMAYESIGKFLKQFIPPDQLNLHTIEAYLRKQTPEELQKILNRNPSYVFFQTTEKSSLTYMGLPATDGRTIATDQRYFPKGALAFLVFDRPKFDSPEALQPSSVEKTSRFVLDQDIGGAIQGGGRLDLFWGRGAEAKLYAGTMKSYGKLYYLAPKKPQAR